MNCRNLSLTRGPVFTHKTQASLGLPSPFPTPVVELGKEHAAELQELGVTNLTVALVTICVCQSIAFTLCEVTSFPGRNCSWGNSVPPL